MWDREREKPDTHQPPHRFVVDCGKPSVVAIFLLPMSEVAIFFDGEGFLCGKDHLAGRVLTNTWDLSRMWLWCVDAQSPAWVSRCEMCPKRAVL